MQSTRLHQHVKQHPKDHRREISRRAVDPAGCAQPPDGSIQRHHRRMISGNETDELVSARASKNAVLEPRTDERRQPNGVLVVSLGHVDCITDMLARHDRERCALLCELADPKIDGAVTLSVRPVLRIKKQSLLALAVRSLRPPVIRAIGPLGGDPVCRDRLD